MLCDAVIRQSPVGACAPPPPFKKGAFGRGELQRISDSDGARERTIQKAPLAKELSARER